jgi:peptidoglycan/LPS O-acetylase OafA/YrhL
LFVVLGHMSRTAGFPLPEVGHAAGTLAAFGVRVFFVISGFLITSLLLREEAKTGRISLGHFYLRRTLRIFPPFYVYVAAVAVAAAVGLIELRRHDLLAAFTYTTNYHHDRAWYLGHAWSLAVEEQFYLLWPFLFAFLGSARAARVALAAVILCPIVRLVLMTGFPALSPGIGETFPTVADAIAIGCLLACYRSRIDSSPRLLALISAPWFWIVPLIAVGATFADSASAKLDGLVGQTVTNVGIALLIERVVRFPTAATGRFLNAGPVVFLGMLSYSLYLWQQPFLNRFASGAINRFPLNIALALAAAVCSYYLIEKPALRLRTRIERALAGRRGATEPPPGQAAATAPTTAAVPPAL